MLYEDTATAFTVVAGWIQTSGAAVVAAWSMPKHITPLLCSHFKREDSVGLSFARLHFPHLCSFSLHKIICEVTSRRPVLACHIGRSPWGLWCPTEPEMHAPEHEVALSTAGRDRCLLCPIGPIQKHAASGT